MQIARHDVRLGCAVLLFVFATTAGVSGQGALVGVAIPVGSQDAGCFPVWAGVYSVSAPPFPFDIATGIGHLVDPGNLGLPTQFALHDHQYVSPYVPDPSRAVVDYTFRWPVTVTAVEIVQHANGISMIEGFAGDSIASLTSVGSTFGPSGDVTGSSCFPEFASQVFNLPSPACGTQFRVVIRKTCTANGWANYRIVPRDASGTQISYATAANALTLVAPSTSSSAGINVDFQMNAGVAFGGYPYVLVGSVSGSCPGFVIPGYGVAPVTYDSFSAYTLTGPYVPETTNYQGLLNASGMATAHIVVAPNAYPTLVGTTFTHSFAAAYPGAFLFSNPVTFTVTP